MGNNKNKGTKGSHFVWRKYLGSFCDLNGNLYVKNKITGEVKFQNSLRVAKKNNIYAIYGSMTNDDISMLFELFKLHPKSDNLFDQDDLRFINELISFFNNDFSYVPGVENIYGSLENLIANHFDQKEIARKQELLFTFYEKKFSNIFSMLLNRNINFYNALLEEHDFMILGFRAGRDYFRTNFLHKEGAKRILRIIEDKNKNIFFSRMIEDGYKREEFLMNSVFPFTGEKYLNSYFFLNFILTQNFRTKKVFDALNGVVKEWNSDNRNLKITNNIIPSFFVHFKTFHIGYHLIEEKYFLVLLRPMGKKKFFTSDHPVVNTYNFCPEDIFNITELELYFPLSPYLSVLVTNKSDYKNIHTLDIEDNLVEYYNNIVEFNSDNFLYSKFDSSF